MVTTPDNLLGVGLYTPAEAALYARVPPKTVRRWLYGSSKEESVIRPELFGRDERVVTFLDFVQTLAIRAVRIQYGVSLQKIRQAVENAKNEYGVEFPFAMQHRTFIFGREVVIKLHDHEFVQLSGKHAKNRMIKEVV
ncbi:MAG TPA: hypothetical protein VFW33_03620, partial [Gemmataceae bacterium]|nr:hypothetical protein [Gemmataceae bacterium]